MFRELLNNQIFSAMSLGTKLDKNCAYVDLQSSTKEIESIIERASRENDDFDNIVVKDGTSYIGVISREDLSKHINDLKEMHISKVNRYSINEDDGLSKVLNRLKDDFSRSDEPKLYFITDHGVPLYIFTYSDLNRRSVYIYFYTLILFLEQWIREKIAENHRLQGRRLDPRWMNALSQDERRNLHNSSVSKKESTLSVAGLKHLIKAYKKDGALEWVRQMHSEIITGKLLNYTEFLRPKVMHPTKLLVPRGDFSNRLKCLQYVSTQISKLIQEEDFNSKNGGWSSR